MILSNPSCGEDLSFSTEFDAIQEMRRADDASLDQGEWVTDLKVADWPGVARRCEELLGTRTKDLRLAGWLVEAWTRLRGFAGLHDGLKLYATLVEQHWDHIHPLPGEGDQEQRIGSITWLLLRVQELARQVPLAKPTANGFSLNDVESLRGVRGGSAGTDAARAEQASKELAALVRSVSGAGLDAFSSQRAAMEGCLAELARLQSMLDVRLAHANPSYGPARRALEAARDAWLRLGRDSGVVSMASDGPAIAAPGEQLPTGEPSSARVPDSSPRSSVDTQALSNRAQALLQLRQVADFFRRTEPHSPVAYLAEKAARWGEMPLHAWLRTVVKDQGTLSQLEELLGSEPPAQQS